MLRFGYLLFVLGTALLFVDACTDHLSTPPISALCRISREVIRRSGTELPARETVSFNGTSYTIASYDTITYQYDAQQRIAAYNHSYVPNPAVNNSTYSYNYLPNNLQETKTGPGSAQQTTTFTLNPQQLIAQNINSPGQTFTYDANGYLIRATNDPLTTENSVSTYTVENGNVVKSTYTTPTQQATVLYEYDLTKPNLPNPFGFRGTQSRNLPLKETGSYDFGSFKTSTVVTYQYQFDAQGRVSRRLRYGVLNGPTNENPFVTLIVSDYTYSCQ